MSLADPDIAGTEIARPLSFARAQRERGTIELVGNALAAGRVRLAYQPVFDARDHARPVYHEALVRVSTRDGTVLPARAFVPSIEHDETGRLVDGRALELGLAMLDADPALTLAVNISPRSIGSPHWLTVFDRHLDRDTGSARRLIVEITESSAMLMPDIVRNFVAHLRASGARVALDDFGAGFTAFRHLRELRVDILKIDGQFSRDVASSPDNQVLMRALISIGAHFGMSTVAECVETRADAEWLAEAGISCLQGYHLARPMDAPLNLPTSAD